MALDRERLRGVQKISNDYLAAVRQEKLLEEAFAQKQKQANLIAEKSVEYEILSHDVDTNKSLYDGLLQRLKEAGVSAGLKASNIRIVDAASASFKPVAPNVPLNLGLAVVVGLALGVSVAFLREYLNRTILSAEDVDRFLTAPALASDSMLLGENICECSAASCPRQSGESAAPAASGKPPGSSRW